MFLIMLLLVTFPLFMVFALFFGSIIMTIVTTLLSILLMYKADDKATIKPGILFLIFGYLFYIFISLNHGLTETFSYFGNIGLYMTLAEFASVAGFVAFMYFIKDTFYLISNFFTRIFERICLLFGWYKDEDVEQPKFTKEELNNYYLYNNEYINWLHSYTNRKSFIKTSINNNVSIYRINKTELNIKNLLRFYISLLDYFEKNNIKINDNSNDRYVVISYQSKKFEIGIHKLSGGYVYCKTIKYRNTPISAFPFENILNSKN